MRIALIERDGDDAREGRSARLADVLEGGGHTVLRLRRSVRPGDGGFTDGDGLRSALNVAAPGAVVVRATECAPWLPDDIACPVIIDATDIDPVAWAAEAPDTARARLRALRPVLRRADLVLAPDATRAAALAAPLIDAGRDPRGGGATLVVPDDGPEAAAGARALLAWLDAPAPAPRLPPPPKPAEPALATPPWHRRLGRQWRMVRRKLLAAAFRGHEGDAVVIVTRGDLFPADHGAAVKIVETARGLSRHGRRVGIVTDARGEWFEVIDGEMRRRRIPWWLRLLALPLPLAKLLHYSRDIPESNAFLYLPLSDGSFFWRTLWLARRLRAGVLQAEFPAYAEPCLAVRAVLGTPVVIAQHNVEYARLEAQVPEMTPEQAARYRAIERSLCRRADAVVCVSENDRALLETAGVAAEALHVVPHGVDLDSYGQPAEPGLRARLGIPGDALLLAYHGTFSYPPNLEALNVFSRDLLPRLEARGLDAHVLAVGRNPPPRSPHPRIHLAGAVETMAPWLKAADLEVVPLLAGGGTRMKIIDCFAAGLPVVSTAKGIEGIPVVPGRDALVIDDWDEMADAIAGLAADPEKARALGAAGRRLAEGLDWRRIAARYLAVYGTLQPHPTR